jgi:hypothetical protein
MLDIAVLDAEWMAGDVLAEILDPPPPIDYLKWAEDNIVFSDRESEFSGPYNRQRFRYFDEILLALSPDDPCRIVSLAKSAQLGRVSDQRHRSALRSDRTDFKVKGHFVRTAHLGDLCNESLLCFAYFLDSCLFRTNLDQLVSQNRRTHICHRLSNRLHSLNAPRANQRAASCILGSDDWTEAATNGSYPRLPAPSPSSQIGC